MEVAVITMILVLRRQIISLCYWDPSLDQDYLCEVPCIVTGESAHRQQAQAGELLYIRKSKLCYHSTLEPSFLPW